MASRTRIVLLILGATGLGLYGIGTFLIEKLYVDSPEARRCELAIQRHLNGVGSHSPTVKQVEDALVAALKNAGSDPACKYVDVCAKDLKESHSSRKLTFTYTVNSAPRTKDIMIVTGPLR
jgi:hypothetical protein